MNVVDLSAAVALKTNIKNLPEGRRYWTEYGYSQSYAWVEISRTDKTVTLARVDVAKDPDWKPDFDIGGFAAHCSNQSDQTWLFSGIDDRTRKTIRFTKRGWSYKGVNFLPNRAINFYDYNF